MTFIEQITEAYEAKKAGDRALADARNLHVEGEIKMALDKLGVSGALITGNIAQIEGVTIRGGTDDYNDRWLWQVHGKCPKCFLLCWSEPCHGLEWIGEMYLNFKPEREHIHSSSGTGSGE